MKTIRIGCGAGYAGDRIDAAVELALQGNLDYLVLECLAERTIALARLAQQANPDAGYGPFLAERMEALLPLCRKKGLAIISNIGAANPRAALKKTVEIARGLKLGPLKVAALQGADVLQAVRNETFLTAHPELAGIADKIVSADAYLGVEEMLPALQAGADVILTGRVADPSLFLAPMVYEFGWQLHDWERLGKGTVFAHLLECGAQVSGGYFADPPYKVVPNLENVGFPLTEVDQDANGYISKAPGTGGLIDVRTCKEQLLYEIHDPAAYLTPDVTADFSRVMFHQTGPSQVAVSGGNGKPRPDRLKVIVGINDGFLAEAYVGFAGHQALTRAEMARSILQHRFERLALRLTAATYEIVGINALHGHIGDSSGIIPYEVMLRVAVKSDHERDALSAVQEAEALWVNGPGGIGGIRKFISPVISTRPITMPRRHCRAFVEIEEVS